MRHSKSILRIAVAAAVLLSAAGGAAVTTNSFVLDSADSFFDGELDGTAVHSEGSVRLGAATERIELPNVPLAYSLARRGNSLFIGTGTNGIVYEVQGKKAKQLADTGELLVSSLAFGRDGALYAGTLPNGVVFRIDPKSGETKRFSTPKGVKHVWALLYDKKRGSLLAGTGPEGKVFAIDSVGQAKEIFASDASHIMTMALDGSDLLAGTSDSALVIRIKPNGKAMVVRDLPGNEVTAVDVLDGRIAVAVNQFKGAPGTQFKGGAAGAKQSRRGTRPRPGSGQGLAHRGRRPRGAADGSKGHALHRRGVGRQWGNLRGGRSRGSHLQSGRRRELLDLGPTSKNGRCSASTCARTSRRSSPVTAPPFIACSKAHRKTRRGPAHRSTRPFSRSGDGSTGAVRVAWCFKTRSGNTKEPGDTWSAWSKELKQPGRIGKPARALRSDSRQVPTGSSRRASSRGALLFAAEPARRVCSACAACAAAETRRAAPPASGADHARQRHVEGRESRPGSAPLPIGRIGPTGSRYGGTCSARTWC